MSAAKKRGPHASSPGDAAYPGPSGHQVALVPRMISEMTIEEVNQVLASMAVLGFPVSGSKDGWKIIGIAKYPSHQNPFYFIIEVFVESPWGDRRSYFMKTSGGPGCVILPYVQVDPFERIPVLMVRQSRGPFGGQWFTELARAGTPPNSNLGMQAGYGESISASAENPNFRRATSIAEWRNAGALRQAGLPLSVLNLLNRELEPLHQQGIGIQQVVPLGWFPEDTGTSMVPVYVYAFQLNCSREDLHSFHRYRDRKGWQLRVHTIEEIEDKPEELGPDAHSSTAFRRFLRHLRRQVRGA